MLPHTPLEQNAMNRFVERFASSIVAVLACHDRVIFHGHLPFGGDDHLNRFVDYGLKIKRKDFLPFVEQQSQLLVDHAKATAQQADAPYEFLHGKHHKEQRVRKLLREQPHDDGLVAVFCCMETCRTVKLCHGQGRPRLRFARRPQRVLYYYFLDPDCGLIHVRVQTWFPFTTQVYVNGHDWLARQLQQRRLGFVQTDNAFTELDDPVQAQQLADTFPKLDWRHLLDRWASAVNPLLQQPWLEKRAYRWVIDQAEFSTDLLFDSRKSLAELYKQLVEHATRNLSAADLMSFLGRRLHPRFDGEILSDCKTERLPGTRVKHRVKNNWLKMYDKFGLILRIETVINQPREFKVRRERERQGLLQMVWCPMNKGIANFYHYHDVARASNDRYLAALATVAMPCATVQQLDRVQQPVRYRGRRQRALNVMSAAEQSLFLAVLRGNHRLNGFRNADVAGVLFPTPAHGCKEQRRRTAHVARKLQLLRAHGLIAAVPHSYRYHITAKGEELMGAAIYVRYKAFPKELSDVA
jgi:hypothetical protein